MRRLPALLFAVAVLAGCASEQTAKPSPSYQVYATDGRSILVFDAASGSELRTLPIGSPAPDWSALYVAKSEAGKTLVEALDPRTGSTLRSVKLEGEYELPTPNMSGLPAALSPDGSWLVLRTPGSAPSRFAVLDTAFVTKPKTFQLDGNFEFDALSNDGRHLYLLQHLSTTPAYSVRLYDLRLGQLNPAPIVDKREPDEAMQGLRVNSINSPDGEYHYGLYARANGAPFIHALPLDEGVLAWCVDLPAPATALPNVEWSLARTPDGHIYALDSAGDLVAELRPGDPPVIARTLKLQPAESWLWRDAEAKEIPGTSAAVASASGTELYAAGPQGVYAIALDRFAVSRVWPFPAQITSMVGAHDGTRLFALTESLKMYAIDLASGQVSAGVYLHPLSPAASLALLR